MNITCQCREGHPYITALRSDESAKLIAQHHCSQCGALLFEVQLTPGLQMCATRDIRNCDGNYTIPKGRLVRLTGFTDKAGSVRLLFSGLLAAGAFDVEGFAAYWDIKRLVNN